MTAARADGLVVPEETMGDRIRRARRYLKLNQAEFAALVGASRERVGLWETGTRQVPLKDGARIARVLREWHSIDADWLLGVATADVPPMPERVKSSPEETGQGDGVDRVTNGYTPRIAAAVTRLRTSSAAA